MSRHKVYVQPGERRQTEMRQRAHRNRRGQEKNRYTPEEASEVILDMRRNGKGTLHAYPCPECGWIHVGHPAPRNERARVDPLRQLELGDRVEACERLENQGSQAQRLATIMQRLTSAETKRLTTSSRTSPP